MRTARALMMGTYRLRRTPLAPRLNARRWMQRSAAETVVPITPVPGSRSDSSGRTTAATGAGEAAPAERDSVAAAGRGSGQRMRTDRL